MERPTANDPAASILIGGAIVFQRLVSIIVEAEASGLKLNYPADTCAELCWMAMHGVASALMKAMLAWGKAQGCTHAWVATETDNEQAKGFYAAQRFMHDTIALFARELS